MVCNTYNVTEGLQEERFSFSKVQKRLLAAKKKAKFKVSVIFSIVNPYSNLTSDA